MASAGVDLTLLSPSMLQFVPRPFGSNFQVILNATSFSTIIAQLHEVSNSGIQSQDHGDPPPVSLLTGSCMTDTGPNCTVACADPASMFNSSFTFFSCLTLGASSLLAATGDIRFTEGTLAASGNQLGFASLAAFDGKQILDDALMCVKASCQDYSLGTCASTINALNISTSATPVTDLYDGLKGYCGGMSSIVNADIAGPGVVLSYVFQAAVAILFFLLTNIFTRWTQPIVWPFIVLNRRLHPGDTDRSGWQAAGMIQGRLMRSKPARAMMATLVEFQEIQGFFVGAIQLATLAVYAPGKDSASLDSISSLGEAVLNAELVQTLSVNGVLPILFIQISLFRSGVRWWYMLCIVIAVFGISVIILTLNLTPKFDELWAYFKESAPIEMCGGNPSPMTYCLDSLSELNDGMQPLSDGVIIGCIAMVALLLGQMNPWITRKLDLNKWLDTWETSRPTILCFRRRVWPVASNLLWTLLELGLLVYVGIYLKALLAIMSRVSTDSSQWGYGQLVSIMVWAPVLGKFVYFNIFGIVDGVGKRLPPEFKVVHDTNGEFVHSESKQEQGVEMDIFRTEKNPTLISPPSFESTIAKDRKKLYVRRRHLSDVSNDFKSGRESPQRSTMAGLG